LPPLTTQKLRVFIFAPSEVQNPLPCVQIAGYFEIDVSHCFHKMEDLPLVTACA